MVSRKRSRHRERVEAMKNLTGGIIEPEGDRLGSAHELRYFPPRASSADEREDVLVECANRRTS
jgi:hypothetical protein